ncbi:hypothetical protein [Rhodococcus sp. DMU1]|nr:hypothetical protein [Rhodococcus sp. DMU1]
MAGIDPTESDISERLGNRISRPLEPEYETEEANIRQLPSPVVGS